MKTFKGTPHGVDRPIIGRIETDSSFTLSKGRILLSPSRPAMAAGYEAVITTDGATARTPGVTLTAEAVLKAGDIVSIQPDGTVTVLWEKGSGQNLLFVTDFCNSRCIMCPQVAQGEMRDYYSGCEEIIGLVDPDGVENIGISGGEPTLDDVALERLLKLCAKRVPGASVVMLTNGKRFADFEVARRIHGANPRLVACIPLYADNAEEHDAIVGAPGSFRETVLGLYNIARLRRPLEIRVVIVRQNYRRLPDLAEFLYRNFPFASHVALMGMETSGLAKKNLDTVWVDPVDYMDQLGETVAALRRRAVNVSVYNLPYCVLRADTWRYACCSISEWKRTYADCCGACSVREDCPGLFATSIKQSRGIVPVTG